MLSKARFEGLVGPIRLVWPSLKIHFIVLKEALSKDGLITLLHPLRLRDTAIARLFIAASDGFVAYEDTTVVPSLVSAAYGRVLELGPGPGNQLHRFDMSRVHYIYGVEPGPNYADNIATKLKKLDLQDKYRLVTCGIEDSEVLRSEGIEEGSMDTVISIQVLCSVRDVKSVMKEIWKLLKPGGSFVFWEHGRSRDSVTAVAQACWNPTWDALVGCNMNREILKEILAAGEWENTHEIEVEDDPNNCLPRISGVLKKKERA